MINGDLKQTAVSLEDFLLDVRKPARYIGHEHNSVFKPQKKDTINFALCFADAYEVGMSHLGIKILYSILNKIEDVYCERCFSPWTDMEEQLRKRGISLFSLETSRPIKNYDVIGFSLQYELGYTNVLNMLDLAGVPLKSDQRDLSHPLVIAGGACVSNPEPMADFIDVFFIGETEESIVEFIDVYREFKKEQGLAMDLSDKDELARKKKVILCRLSRIPGAYVPGFYRSGADNRIVPIDGSVCPKIARSFVQDLDKADYFTSPPVPYIDIVHDRISLEIMRGCPNRCYFCQAGFTINPVRIRKPETILSLAEKNYANTGYDDISFCALSSASYPQLGELIKKMYEFCKPRGIGISLPSLRVDKQFLGLISMLEGLKKTGLTFAPEAGSLRLRKIINKDIDIQSLKQAVLEAYRQGWKRLKLYFMIGLPTETEDDLLAIVEMIKEFSALRKQVDRKWGQVSVGISNFIPKPHTPFQWLGMQNVEQLKDKQEFLRSRLKQRSLEVDFHNPEMSFIEAAVCRGNRQTGRVIYNAFKLGARFDAWTNMFDFRVWQKAFEQADIKAEESVYLLKDYAQPLSWDHIDCKTDKNLLIGYAKAVL